MNEAETDYLKEMKKQSKMIKRIDRVLQFIPFLLLAIIILLAFTPHVSAWVNCTAPAFAAGNSSWGTGTPANACDGTQSSEWARGAPSDVPPLAWFRVIAPASSSHVRLRTAQNYWQNYTLQGDFANQCFAFNNATPKDAYWECPVSIATGEWLNVSGGNPIYWYGISDIQFDGIPTTPSGTFTAIPSSGNQSLSVVFTPTFTPPTDLNRIVWDFDGGLGSETKYDLTPFTKIYSTAGHYTASASFYSISGSVITSSQAINVYNYTLGITPTPTLTPVPTPTGQTNASNTFKITGYDIGNLTKISGLSIAVIDTDDVGSGWFNVTANSGEYTFIGYGSGGNKPFVVGHNYMFVLSKSGYETKTSVSQFSNGMNSNGYYLSLSSYTPTATGFTLGVRLISTTTGDILTPLSGTVMLTNQSSSWTTTQTNPSAGLPMFAGLTPANSYKIDINVIGYEYYTGYFASSSSMAGTTQWYYAYITPKNVLPSAFTLSVSPESGTVNDTYTMKLTGDISGASAIAYKYSTDQSGLLSFTATSGYTQYSKVGASWLGWDGTGFTVATSNPAQVTGHISSNTNPNVNTMSITAYITIAGNVYQATDTVNIIAGGKEPVIIVAYDMITSGSSMSTRLDTFTSHIYDVYTNTWDNRSFTADNFYNAYYFYTPNSLITYYGSALGYYDTTPQTRILPDLQRGIEYQFYPVSLPTTLDNVSLNVNVRTVNSQALPQAKVSLSDGQKCFTNTQGSCAFNVLNNANYTASANAYGYGGGAGSIKTSNTSANIINLVLVRASTTTSPYSGIQTPKVTPTFTNTSGLTNTTGLTEAVCTHDTKGMGIFQVLMNNVACAGVTGAIAQGFVLSALIMFVFAMGLTRYGKGLGALAGVIIGAVVSWGMQLLPLWTLIVCIIMCGLIFAALITKQGSGG